VPVDNQIGLDAGDVKVGNASAAAIGVHDGKVVVGNVTDVVQVGSVKRSPRSKAQRRLPWPRCIRSACLDSVASSAE
jgi:hypothetical protein